MAKHLIVLSVVMEEMDGSPEESAEILLGEHMPGTYDVEKYRVLLDYLDGGEVEVTAEDITPADKDWDLE